jgi:hypothetical protein
LLDLFRRSPPIRDADALADFIDRNAAFITQKGIYEYSRARAGHYAKVLFREPEFHEALEHSRWRAYPLGLAIVAEVVDAVLLTLGGEKGRRERLAAIEATTLSAFDRYPVPAVLTTEIWQELRAELARRLQLIGLHPRKPAMDIPEQFADSYFALMPIHEKLRGRDFITTRNYLRVTVLNIHEELSKRIDTPALIGALKT